MTVSSYFIVLFSAYVWSFKIPESILRVLFLKALLTLDASQVKSGLRGSKETAFDCNEEVNIFAILYFKCSNYP